MVTLSVLASAFLVNGREKEHEHEHEHEQEHEGCVGTGTLPGGSMAAGGLVVPVPDAATGTGTDAEVRQEFMMLVRVPVPAQLGYFQRSKIVLPHFVAGAVLNKADRKSELLALVGSTTPPSRDARCQLNIALVGVPFSVGPSELGR